ncbi:MAG TPA: hypothetical protein VEJ63_12595 [Planctomycetota bacterium]|nr:hypothetical protein [Planctomycetota bacterium]
MRYTWLALLVGPALTAAEPVVVKNADNPDAENTFQIGPRDGAKIVPAETDDSVSIGKRERLRSSLKADEYQKEAANIARELAAASGSDFKADLIEEIRREPERSGAAFALLLDPRHAPDVKTRKGAALGIGLSNASTKTVGKALGNAALSETDSEVRQAVISTIQQRKDALALHQMMASLADSSDPEGLGFINEKKRENALNALRDVGDRRIYHALLYYVTLEIRAGTASLVALNNVFITNSGDVNNGAVGQTSINLPIDLPTLELNSVQGTIIVPAVCKPQDALRKVTGQDFGKNIDQWRAWIEKQPEIKK